MALVTAVPWTPEHVAVVSNARLAKKRGGYNCDDVDRVLQHTVALMRSRRQVPPVPATGLRRSSLREGYTVEAVDALFGHIAQWQDELLAHSASAVAAPVVASDVRLSWTPQQMDWVRESNFRPARGKRGYAEDEVDKFLDEVLLAMGKGEALPDIDSVRFYPPRAGRAGYEALSVDRFLDELKRIRPLRG
ncbi:DivIVA domain-containing protein [Yimella sp. cx-51]|uniref:DivIVA domain-containing protein n=1 Tax=Yimella sp. cx-51 TaxID=2770551 RepID=UPI00165D4E27|nr:DivIVA domain-containing protein [Yimella sp. cx-51]MBC9956629.1 DivIVA domain-containing protein [Yimella sp. cx-51]QTH38274.1 DivIVA domain-containing protein [Yimella sp. cx-51]